MVRHHPHPLTDRQGTDTRSSELTVLLAETDQCHVIQRNAVQTQDSTKPTRSVHMNRTGVLRHRERPEVQDGAVWVCGDHRPHHADGDVLRPTASDGRLEAVEERVVTGPHLRDSLKVVHMHHRRCRADADLRTRNPHAAEAL